MAKPYSKPLTGLLMILPSFACATSKHNSYPEQKATIRPAAHA